MPGLVGFGLLGLAQLGAAPPAAPGAAPAERAAPRAEGLGAGEALLGALQWKSHTWPGPVEASSLHHI